MKAINMEEYGKFEVISASKERTGYGRHEINAILRLANGQWISVSGETTNTAALDKIEDIEDYKEQEKALYALINNNIEERFWTSCGYGCELWLTETNADNAANCGINAVKEVAELPEVKEQISF